MTKYMLRRNKQEKQVEIEKYIMAATNYAKLDSPNRTAAFKSIASIITTVIQFL